MKFWYDILVNTGLPAVVNILRKNKDEEISKKAKRLRKLMMEQVILSSLFIR